MPYSRASSARTSPRTPRPKPLNKQERESRDAVIEIIDRMLELNTTLDATYVDDTHRSSSRRWIKTTFFARRLSNHLQTHKKRVLPLQDDLLRFKLDQLRHDLGWVSVAQELRPRRVVVTVVQPLHSCAPVDSAAATRE